MGIEPWELDVGWITLRVLESLALVHDVKSWSRGNVTVRGMRIRARVKTRTADKSVRRPRLC
jgi:hypothetical protein